MLKVRRLSSFFFDDDAYTFTSTRRRLMFSATTQGIRLRRRSSRRFFPRRRTLFYLLQHLTWRPTLPENQPAHLANVRLPSPPVEGKGTGLSICDGAFLRNAPSYHTRSMQHMWPFAAHTVSASLRRPRRFVAVIMITVIRVHATVQSALHRARRMVRDNWLGRATTEGAAAAAVIHTFVQLASCWTFVEWRSCRRHAEETTHWMRTWFAHERRVSVISLNGHRCAGGLQGNISRLLFEVEERPVVSPV